jgi:hypothetical protein
VIDVSSYRAVSEKPDAQGVEDGSRVGIDPKLISLGKISATWSLKSQADRKVSNDLSKRVSKTSRQPRN